MQAVVRALRWVWDFVIGDAVLVAGVGVAMLLAYVLQAATAHSLRILAAPVLFLAVIAAIGVSLWREVGAR